MTERRTTVARPSGLSSALCFLFLLFACFQSSQTRSIKSSMNNDPLNDTFFNGQMAGNSPGALKIKGKSILTPRGSRDDERFVYRADTRPPENIKKAQGFWPKRPEVTEDKYFSLLAHCEGKFDVHQHTEYVSASRYPKEAMGLLVDQGGSGWLYEIHKTPNMIDVDKALDEDNPYRFENEKAVLGGIRWDQVHRYRRIEGLTDDVLRRESNEPEKAMRDAESNDDYDDDKYLFADEFKGLNVYVENLAGLHYGAGKDKKKHGKYEARRCISCEKSARQFMDKFGAVVGWKRGQAFPLFTPPPESPTEPPEEEAGPSTVSTKSFEEAETVGDNWKLSLDDEPLYGDAAAELGPFDRILNDVLSTTSPLPKAVAIPSSMSNAPEAIFVDEAAEWVDFVSWKNSNEELSFGEEVLTEEEARAAIAKMVGDMGAGIDLPAAGFVESSVVGDGPLLAAIMESPASEEMALIGGTTTLSEAEVLTMLDGLPSTLDLAFLGEEAAETSAILLAPLLAL